MTEDSKPEDVVWQGGGASRGQRARLSGHRGATVWITGLPASGKSTLAFALEAALLGAGRAAYVLDGDNVRHGLCADLGFSAGDRTENVRRVAEVARLFADSGTVAIVALVSPHAAGRDAAREVHDRAELPFLEVWMDTPLSVCEQRDPKGLYGRARAGSLRGLTGIDDPYEAPAGADLVLRSQESSVDDEVARVVEALAQAEQRVALPATR